MVTRYLLPYLQSKKRLKISLNQTTFESSKAIGKLMADYLKKNKIERVSFDRSGYKYHGKIKALADSMRENGVKI